MSYLLSAIALNTLIFLIFRSFDSFKINIFPAIVANYIVCSCIGFYFLEDFNQLVLVNPRQIWAQTALILGVLFIFTFYLIGQCTQNCGVSTTTIASKMSLVIPVAFSLYVFDSGEKLDATQVAGIISAIVALFLASIKEGKKGKNKLPWGFTVLLPLLVFFFGGAIDTLINYSKLHIHSAETDKIYTTLIFATAAFAGVVVLVIKIFVKRELPDFKSLFAGILLGIPNFFSIFFIVKTLTAFKNNGAFVYPLTNVGVILLSSVLSVVIFKESLSMLNKIGLLLAVIALILISHNEILDFMHFSDFAYEFKA